MSTYADIRITGSINMDRVWAKTSPETMAAFQDGDELAREHVINIMAEMVFSKEASIIEVESMHI